jgi:hypothetical protein
MSTDLSGNNIKPDTNNFKNDNYFNLQTMLLLLSVLILYFVLNAVTGIFFNSEDISQQSTKASFIDFILIAVIAGAALIYYYSLPPSLQDSYWDDILTSTKGYLNNAYSILGVVMFIIVLYTGIYLFGIKMTPESKPWTISFLESNAYLLLLILGAIQFFKIILKIDVVPIIFGDKPLPAAPAVVIDSKGTVKTGTEAAKDAKKEETFNISNNLYSYEDGRALCKAMGARLATYDEVEDAYQNGAEWSTYGWSEGQHAYFPTQKETWNKLQKIKGHEHDLGRPGVNGGYFSNPNVRFGVNCYGVKPPMTESDKALMNSKKDRIYPKTKEDQLLDAKVEFWKANKDKMIVLSGYNNEAWSRY